VWKREKKKTKKNGIRKTGKEKEGQCCKRERLLPADFGCIWWRDLHKVHHNALYMKLMKRYIPVKLFDLFENLLSVCYSRVKGENAWSEIFTMHFGVRQNSVLSPFLFAVYPDDPSNLWVSDLSSYITLYADDSIAYPNYFLYEVVWIGYAINRSISQVASLDFVVNRFFMKLFNTSDINICKRLSTSFCISFTGCTKYWKIRIQILGHCFDNRIKWRDLRFVLCLKFIVKTLIATWGVYKHCVYIFHCCQNSVQEFGF